MENTVLQVKVVKVLSFCKFFGFHLVRHIGGGQRRRSILFIVSFEHILHLFLVFLLEAWNN